MARPRKDVLDATDSNSLAEQRYDGGDTGVGIDAENLPENELDHLRAENESKDLKIARMDEELQRVSQVVSLLAKKESIPDGVVQKELVDGEGFVPFTRDGKRFVSWEAVSSFEEPIGETMQKHFVYKITYVDKDGVETIENNVPHRLFKNKMADSVKVPAKLPNYLRRVREGDHYVYRAVPALAHKPYEPTDLVTIVLGRTLPDKKTRVYDGDEIKAYFYTFNAS